MIYFLVNNDYHLHLDVKLAKQIPDLDLGLIQVPYSLNIINDNDVFSKVYHFGDRIIPSLKGVVFHYNKIKRILTKVDKDLKPKKDDILLVHTDMEMLNQYIIQKFYNVKAKIFLIEDGTATMCYYNMKPNKVSIKDNLRSFILKYCYKFKYLEIKKYGVETLPVMKDFIFNGVIVNYGDVIKRNIPLYKLDSLEKPIKIIHENGAIFFSQPQYLWFITEEKYISYIDDLLSVSKFFSPFYFKFHPADNEFVRFSISKLINEKYADIIIILGNDIAENIINKYPVQYAITFNSTAAFNLISKGIIPIFLNNIFHELYPDTSFVAFGQFLKSINCATPSKLADIKPGFCAFGNAINNKNKYSLIDIIK